MFLLTLKDQQDEGAYAVENRYGDKVLFLFQKHDDAERYAMMLQEQDEERPMGVMEVDDMLAINTCRRYNYKYSVITPNDIVVPLNYNDELNDNISKD